MANEQQPAQQLSAQGAARRRFTRAGAAASGVLLTLHSQPGMAQVMCTTASGFQSLQGGSHNPRVATCGGSSPGVWGQSLDARGANKNTPGEVTWPQGLDANQKLFRDWFPATASGRWAQLAGDQATLKKVLTSDDNHFDPANFGAHLVACYLNKITGLSPYPDEKTLTDMWVAISGGQLYYPNGGAKGWNVDYCKYYMTSTWHKV